MTPFERRTEAAKLAHAIAATTARYQTGMMVRATWRAHLRHLVAKAEERGVVFEVVAELMSVKSTDAATVHAVFGTMDELSYLTK